MTAVVKPDLVHVRSALFVPGGREGALAKAASLPADMIVVDLEDAVIENGDIDPAKAMAAQRKIPEKLEPTWEYLGEGDPDAEYVPEWEELDETGPAIDGQMKWGPDQRQRKLKFLEDADRRFSRHGRRNEDNPKKPVW